MKTTPSQTPPSDYKNITLKDEDLIRVRAYELFEQRGREDGHDLDDWLTAENEMTNVRAKRFAA